VIKQHKNCSVYRLALSDSGTNCVNGPNSGYSLATERQVKKIDWQQGSLETLCWYRQFTHTYTADDLDRLLERAEHQRLMLISDTAGMGKSTVLTHLIKQNEQKFQNECVVRIDLMTTQMNWRDWRKKGSVRRKQLKFYGRNCWNLNLDYSWNYLNVLWTKAKCKNSKKM